TLDGDRLIDRKGTARGHVGQIGTRAERVARCFVARADAGIDADTEPDQDDQDGASYDDAPGYSHERTGGRGHVWWQERQPAALIKCHERAFRNRVVRVSGMLEHVSTYDVVVVADGCFRMFEHGVQ